MVTDWLTSGHLAQGGIRFPCVLAYLTTAIPGLDATFVHTESRRMSNGWGANPSQRRIVLTSTAGPDVSNPRLFRSLMNFDQSGRLSSRRFACAGCALRAD